MRPSSAKRTAGEMNLRRQSTPPLCGRGIEGADESDRGGGPELVYRRLTKIEALQPVVHQRSPRVASRVPESGADSMAVQTISGCRISAFDRAVRQPSICKPSSISRFSRDIAAQYPAATTGPWPTPTVPRLREPAVAGRTPGAGSPFLCERPDHHVHRLRQRALARPTTDSRMAAWTWSPTSITSSFRSRPRRRRRKSPARPPAGLRVMVDRLHERSCAAQVRDIPHDVLGVRLEGGRVVTPGVGSSTLRTAPRSPAASPAISPPRRLDR